MKKCIDCGQQFADTLSACPNCGCPANLCDSITTQLPWQQQSTQQATTSVNSNISSCNSGVTDPGYLFGRDWSHYIYECAVMSWHAMTSHAFDFKGRATRRQFWSVFFMLPLVEIAIQVAIGLFCLATDASIDGLLIYFEHSYEYGLFEWYSVQDVIEIIILMILYAIAIIGMFVLALAIAIRRMHDGNHRGWWCLVPFVYPFYCLQRSDAGTNRFGPPVTDLGI
ncbi:MAG: DUF805 domain-containing protein [Muribaculaceae bacterium]|nr:DUF805 domain-containing protein [Muribaculaceae bacterium]